MTQQRLRPRLATHGSPYVHSVAYNSFSLWASNFVLGRPHWYHATFRVQARSVQELHALLQGLPDTGTTTWDA